MRTLGRTAVAPREHVRIVPIRSWSAGGGRGRFVPLGGGTGYSELLADEKVATVAGGEQAAEARVVDQALVGRWFLRYLDE